MDLSEQLDRISADTTVFFLAYYEKLMDADSLDKLAAQEVICTRTGIKRFSRILMDRLQAERNRLLMSGIRRLSEETGKPLSFTEKNGEEFPTPPPVSVSIPLFLPSLSPFIYGLLAAFVCMGFLLIETLLACLTEWIAEPASVLIHAAAVLHLGKPVYYAVMLISVLLMMRMIILHGSPRWAAVDQLTEIFQENDVSGKYCHSIKEYWETQKKRLQD